MTLEFDYVVVGAGSAGCALAARLSEDGRHTVALVEAGGRDRSPWIHIPVGYFKTMGNPKTDWRYRTEPDPGLNGRSIAWPRGRVLGGSSSINGLLYVRGQREDYERWRQMGCAGWGWDEVAPCFRRAESWEDGDDGVRGGNGPLSVSRTRLSRPAVDRWVEAAVSAGYPLNPDYNGADQEGVGLYQLTARDGRRCSAARAYLAPARRRENLAVLTGLVTTRVLFDGARAVGIQAQGGNGLTRITARGEVILSAGAIGSPQILMLSGIGPAEHLGEHGIAVLRDAPNVGGNLQDHLQARPIFRVRSSTINTETRSWLRKGLIGLEYATRRTGAMTMAASLGYGFVRSRPEVATPDIQFHVQPFSTDTIGTKTHPFDAITTSVLQLRPESRGHLRLRSPDPDAHPLIHPNYLATETDRRTIVEGVRVARRIATHEPFRSEIVAEHAPGGGVHDDDDAAILQWVRDTATTIYHPTGTCRMGADERAVLDPALRVRGVEGLRVADCSIMPEIVSANTNAPAIMIGERASDLVRADAP